jgi:hypothetical protein
MQVVSHMNVYSEKLNHGASEVLEYYDRNKVKFNNEERRWLYLSRKMKEAALLKENTHAEKAIHQKGDRFIYQSFFARLGEELLSKGGRLCQGLGEWYYPNIHITLFNGGITAKLCLPNRRTIDAI